MSYQITSITLLLKQYHVSPKYETEKQIIKSMIMNVRDECFEFIIFSSDYMQYT